MNCCSVCNIESETTITAVVLVGQNQTFKKKKLQQFIENNMNLVREATSSREKDEYKYKQLLKLNKENQSENVLQNESKTRRKGKAASQVIESFLVCEEQGAETGRFNQANLKSSRNDESRTKRFCQSKTTSFGSRKSSTLFYKQRQVQIMQQQLKKLKDEELKLHKEKLDKEFLYQKELAKINFMKQQLKSRSKQRYSDLSQLRQLFKRHKRLSIY